MSAGNYQLCYGVLQKGLAIQIRDLGEDLTSGNIIIVWCVSVSEANSGSCNVSDINPSAVPYAALFFVFIKMPLKVTIHLMLL